MPVEIVERPAAREEHSGARPESTTPRVGHPAVAQPGAWCVAVILLAALALRLPGLDVFAVVDESKFAVRSTAFYNAIGRGDLAETYQSPHPAVVTLWIGAIASGVQSLETYGRLCQAVTIRPDEEPDACALSERRLITGLHLGNAILTWGLLAASAICLQRLYDGARASLLLGLIALDPFVLAHSRLAHHEGILAGALLASTLLLALYARRGGMGLLAASAAIAGLGIAEKLPGLYAFAPAVVLLYLAAWRKERGWARLRRWAASMVAWSAISIGAVFLLWPALWTSTLPVLRLLFGGLSGMLREAVSGQQPALPQAAATHSGSLLYPLTLLFRLTPVSLLGFGGALVLVIVSRPLRRQIAPWLVYAGGFIVLLALVAKQGGGYMLSAFPAIDIAAGLAWWRLGAVLAPRVGRLGRLGFAPPVLALLSMCLAYIVPTAPYYLTSYNWLAGGPRVATRVLDIGMGEGLDQAARYLNDLPNARGLVVSTGYREAFAPFFAGESHSLEYSSVYRSDYVVFYIQQWLERPDWSLWKAYRDRDPVRVVELSGITYARIYANEPPTRALQFLAGNAVSRDLLVAEIPSLLTRNYSAVAPLWVPTGTPQEAAADLSQRLAGADSAWWVIYPMSRGEYGEVIAEVMLGQTESVSSSNWGEIQVERRVPVRLPSDLTTVPSAATTMAASVSR